MQPSYFVSHQGLTLPDTGCGSAADSRLFAGLRCWLARERALIARQRLEWQIARDLADIGIAGRVDLGVDRRRA